MNVGQRRHTVTFQNPGAAVPDGDGGFTQAWTDVSPPDGWKVSIEPASVRDLERVAAGTILTTATSLVNGRYLPGVSVLSRMVFNGRTFAISGTRNIQERSIDMELIAIERLGPQ